MDKLIYAGKNLNKMKKLILLPILIILIIPFSYANGGCIKVVDDVLVQLSSAPLVPNVNKQVSFLISFANREKELINQEITGKISIIKGKETKFFKDFEIQDGVLDLKYTFKDSGLHEVFLEFKIKNKTYTPEDFLIEVKEEKQNIMFNVIYLIIGAIIGAVLVRLIRK